MADAPIVLPPLADEPIIDAKLTAEQSSVLRSVMYGKTISAAASDAGVSRSTVYRWQSENAEYIAAVNAWQRQTSESARNRLLAMADKAVVAIHTALLSCDAKTAMSLLKNLGLLQPPAPGSSNAEMVRRQLLLDRSDEKRNLIQRAREIERGTAFGFKLDK